MQDKSADNQILCLYKKVGETPLECLDRFRADNTEYRDEKLSYAGRLDPMAEGLLLVLVGEENKQRKKYLGLDKEYECEVLFGVTTDSFDLLGLVKEVSQEPLSLDKKELESALKDLEGKREMEYPPYSSKTVEGKQLWQWAREGKVEGIDIPTRQVEISSLTLEGFRQVKKSYIIDYINDYITKVTGDFRQPEIISRWKAELADTDVEEFPLAQVRVRCSSGTYIRRLADTLGRTLGVGAIAFSIKRTQVGDYSLKDVAN